MSYTGTQVCATAGITYRQLDHWTRRQLVPLSGDLTTGSGIARDYTHADMRTISFYATLIHAGLTHPAARRLLDEHLRTGEHVLALTPTVTIRVHRPDETLADRPALTVVSS